MTNRLQSLDEVLAPLLAALRPVAPVRLGPWEAVGLPAAADAIAPRAVPAAATALRPGLAVRALDLVGAAAHAPAPLQRIPTRVSAGEALPPGCDAILDPAAVVVEGPVCEAIDAVEPGAWIRLAGHDLQEGQRIVAAGRTLTPEAALALAAAGCDGIIVRRPIVRLEWPESAERDWLRQRLHAIGAAVEAGGAADLVLRPAADGAPRLALRPGDSAWATIADGVAEVALPPRFDGLFGAWCALALPILARITGQALAARPLALTRKLVSAVGLTEIALLRVEAGQAEPLGSGDLTLGAVAGARAFALLAAGSEGAPAGATIDAILLDCPFGPEERTS